MTEISLQLGVLVLAALFTGVVGFLATVLRAMVDALPAEDYHRVQSLVITRGRRSLFINGIVVLPLLGLAAYLALGYSDPLFVVGAVVYLLGALVGSRVLNEPLYARLLRAAPDDTSEVSRVRSRLNQANTARAIVSLSGVVVIALSVA